MKLMFIGDIYAASGRDTVKKYVPELRKKHKIDIVIANGENATHGKGLSSSHYQELLDAGIDIITMGNHFFSKSNPNSFYASADRLVRPYNIHPSAAGVGSRHFEINGFKLRVTNLLGRVYINELSPYSPFDAMDSILETNEDVIHFVDFHAEATAEKIALAYCYSSKVSAVIGTHTHVQTADEKIINGTAFLSDVGMTGPYNSVIGANIEQIIHKTKTGLPMKFDVAEGPGQLSTVIIDIDEKTGMSNSIERVLILPNKDW